MKIKGVVKKLLGDGLVVAEGEKWSKVRKLANHAFYAENLKDMVPAMIASVEAMLEKWRLYEGKEIDVFQEFRFLTSEVISRTAFGSSYLEGKDIFEMLTKLGFIVGRNAEKIRLPGIEKIFRSKDDIESDKIEQSLRNSILAIIKKREDKVMTGETNNFGSDFLGSLLKVRHDSVKKNRISVDDVIDECKVFYIAGHETTSSLLSWTSLLLAINTDWQEKARKEVLELFGKENPTSEGLARLKTVTMVINEALRLYSPVPSLVRRAKGKVNLGEPERFAEGVAKATKNNPMAYLPFGSGPRTCVGLNFATNEVKIALLMILQRYKFTLSPNYVHFPLVVLTVCPQHGVQIMLEPVGV
ncbi:Cytochrome [Abeliophyllum distichum]|uniref:Cytochrome n=1 Tax=Abeliophyllum distichum TaxID=126358 RepID=A0ABD1U386_9LAMI